MRRILSFVIFLTGLGVALTHAEARFSVIAPKGAEAGKKFHVIYRLQDGEAAAPNVSDISGCRFIMGPGITTKSQGVMTPGHSSFSSTIEYSYTYVADSAGSYTIPPATINVDGKTLRTPATKFTVYAANSPAASSMRTPPDPNTGVNRTLDHDKQLGSNDVFIKMIPSRTSVYEHEPIECTIKLYTKYRQIKSFTLQSQPNFDGCLIEEVPVTPMLDNVETLNGQTYSTAILKKVIIFPQQSGRITLNSGKYEVNVTKYEKLQTFFGTQMYAVGDDRLIVNPGDLTINVMPLPEGAPEGFNGAVGHFEVQTRLSTEKLKTNEPATITYIITGTGNISYLKEPELTLPEQFELYPAKSESNTRVAGNNVTGTQTVEFTFVPQVEGDFTLSLGKYSYFDPSTKKYVEIPLPSYNVKVGKGSGVSASGSMKPDGGMKDILHIKPGVEDMSLEHNPTFYSWTYWLFWIVMAMALTGYLYGMKISDRRHADVKGMRLAKAGKVARKRLRKAHMALDSSDNGARFYEELLKGLWGYLSDKLSIPGSELTRENIAAALRERNVPDETIDRVIDILDQSEMARYTPESMSKDTMSAILRQTEEVMEAIQKSK